MEQGIITIEASCKKFILDLIVPYDESYNLKKEEGELFEIDELIKEYSNNFIDSIKLKILKTKIIGDIDFMYCDIDKDSNKITSKVFRYYFAKKCFDARLNTVIGRYSKVEEKDNFKKLNDFFKSCSLHVYHRFELITSSKEELESLRNIRSHFILSMALPPNVRHHYHYSEVAYNGEKLTEKIRFCNVFYLNFIF